MMINIRNYMKLGLMYLGLACIGLSVNAKDTDEELDENPSVYQYGAEIIGDFSFNEAMDNTIEDEQGLVNFYFRKQFIDYKILSDEKFNGTFDIDIFLSESNRTTGVDESASPEIYTEISEYYNFKRPGFYDPDLPSGFNFGFGLLPSYTKINSGNLSEFLKLQYGYKNADDNFDWLVEFGYLNDKELDFSKGNSGYAQLQLRWATEKHKLTNYSSYYGLTLKYEDFSPDQSMLDNQSVSSAQIFYHYKPSSGDDKKILRFYGGIAVGYDDIDNHLGAEGGLESKYVLLNLGFVFDIDSRREDKDGTGRYINGRWYRP